MATLEDYLAGDMSGVYVRLHTGDPGTDPANPENLFTDEPGPVRPSLWTLPCGGERVLLAVCGPHLLDMRLDPVRHVNMDDQADWDAYQAELAAAGLPHTPTK